MTRRLLLTLVTAAAVPLRAQTDPGAALWRLAAQTLPVPPALAQGTGSILWNPAQSSVPRFAVAVEAVQGAAEVGATGVIAVGRAGLGRFGTLSALYAQMRIADLVRTSISPIPDPGAIDYRTQIVGAAWAGALGRATLGVSGGRHTTTLDTRTDARWTVDVGASVPVASRVRLAAATHFFSHLDDSDPAQDLYLGAEALAWRGRPWRGAPETRVYGRYGTAMAHGFTADHHVGAGFAFGQAVTVDLLASYEGGYAGGGWQPVAGVAVQVGGYRVAFAANPGAAGLGGAYRVGLDVGFP